MARRPFSDWVVANTSKIKISKAIHNSSRSLQSRTAVVANTSKIKISKAIHNSEVCRRIVGYVVANTSKIKISKAIHNSLSRPDSPPDHKPHNRKA